MWYCQNNNNKNNIYVFPLIRRWEFILVKWVSPFPEVVIHLETSLPTSLWYGLSHTKLQNVSIEDTVTRKQLNWKAWRIMGDISSQETKWTKEMVRDY